jgi:hypothetical protein
MRCRARATKVYSMKAAAISEGEGAVRAWLQLAADAGIVGSREVLTRVDAGEWSAERMMRYVAGESPVEE